MALPILRGGGVAAASGAARNRTSPALILYLCVTLVATIFVLLTTAKQFGWGDGFSPHLDGKVHIVDRALELVQDDEEQLGFEEGKSILFIQDVVALPEQEFLVLIRRPPNAADVVKPKNAGGDLGSCKFTFGSGSSSKVYPASMVGIDSIQEDKLAIRCKVTEQQLKLEQQQQVSVELESKELSNGLVASSGSSLQLTMWNRLVFDSLLTPQDVVLFSKGIVARQANMTDPSIRGMTCVFVDEEGEVETELLSAGQEIFRCQHPPKDLRKALLGKVSLKMPDGRTILPSVAHYDGILKASSLMKRHSVCACTMVYNSAKFLREWVMYHSHLGVDKFFLYDNNSDDEIQDALEGLNSAGFATARRVWPWIKTQEAGFSHCALSAQQECEWMAFVDVDEFIFPKDSRKYAAPNFGEESSLLARLIDGSKKLGKDKKTDKHKSDKMVGQIALRCLNFGPSGQTRNPESGVTHGYTCRAAKDERHKSIVLLDALDENLINVIHHFKLKPEFSTAWISSSMGVVNHYKYQAWDEFKSKFHRRVSAYVADWKDSKNMKSKDRTPGLGSEEVKPKDWEQRFCEVDDTALRDYVVEVFGSPPPWQVK